MENPLSQNLLFLVMADISAIGRQRVKRGTKPNTVQLNAVNSVTNIGP